MKAELVQAPSMKTYFEATFGQNAARILPGEYHVTRDDLVLVTVLGSCVAACIRDPALSIGGMNHFMLPDSASTGDSSDSASARYGSYAMELLINQLVKLGARRERLEAKVFGGANVMPGMKNVSVGRRNCDFVLAFLDTEAIPIVAQDLESTYPRKVAYFPRTGVVRMKRLVDAGSQKLMQREQQYKVELSKAPIAGDIELFD